MRARFTRPLYVGIAEKQTVSTRVVETHLKVTRGSALRRSLAGLLGESLELRAGAVRHPRGEFGLEVAQESELTGWMLGNLSVAWVELDEPGVVEVPTILDLLPPLNYTYATGSPYRAQMKLLRAKFRAEAPLNWVRRRRPID